MSQRINLYDPRLLPKPDRTDLRHVLIYGLLALLLALAWAALSWRNAQQAQQGLQRFRQQRSTLEQQLIAASQAGRNVDPALSQQIAAEQLELKRLNEALMAAQRLQGKDQTNHYAPLLSALARQAPAGLWLTGFKLDPSGLELQGRSLNAAAPAELARRLSSDPELTPQQFKLLDISSAAAGTTTGAPSSPTVAPVYQFTLSGRESRL